MNFKQQVYQYYLNAAKCRVELLQKMMAGLKDSASNETKSTAGDKHETALAMLQIEQANAGMQLEDALMKLHALKGINPEIQAISIVSGSLVKTNHAYLFLSAALGKTEIERRKVIALSPQSPLGQKLLGLKKGDLVKMNQMEYAIEEIH